MSFVRRYDEALKRVPEQFTRYVDLNLKLVDAVDKLFAIQLQGARGVYRGNIESFRAAHSDYTTSPFTVLEIDSGKPKEIPYSMAYQDELGPIIKLIDQIVDEIDSLEVDFDKTRWRALYQAVRCGFEEDRWEQAEHAFLDFDLENPFLLSIGPIERYHDKHFGKKRYYSALFAMTNDRFQAYRDCWNALDRCMDSHNVFASISDDPGEVHLFIGDILAEGGEFSKLDTEGWSRPEDPLIAKQCGTVKMMLMNGFQRKLSTLEEYASKSAALFGGGRLLEQLAGDELAETYMMGLMLHEYGHTYTKSAGATSNLGDYYTLFEEARAEANSLYLAKLLEQSGAVPAGTAQRVFMLDLMLFEFKYDRWKRLGCREEYLYSTTLWLQSALRHEIIWKNNEKFTLNQSNLQSELPTLIKEVYQFTHAATFFGHRENAEIERYRNACADLVEELILLWRS